MRISLTDNNSNSPYRCSRDGVKGLFRIAGKKVSELCRENENLLVFPYSIDATEDRIGNSTILTIKSTNDHEIVSLQTSNIMGFIGTGDVQVKIQSRFDRGRDDFFLHYMLQKVMSLNLFDLCHDTEQNDIFDFMMLMFPHYLKNAMRQGLYREYQHFRHNDHNVKGVIDVGRHISRNVPFIGNIAYNTHEYTYDNDVTELVRHTIEFMQAKQYGKMILGCDEETITDVKSIVENTPLYNRNHRSQVINSNLRLKSHPYFTEYRTLQVLCLHILRMEEIKYGEQQEDEICGILFDGAWLWEEYLNTILKQADFQHPENKMKKGGLYLFKDALGAGRVRMSGVRYPDFYKNGIVIDAKYKRLEKYDRVSQMDRDDIHQMIAYITHLHAHNGVFACPKNQGNGLFFISSRLAANDANISIIGLNVSDVCSSYYDFCKDMQRAENAFLTRIRAMNCSGNDGVNDV